MKKPTLHIINHTHWDREWFLTSVYTSQWIAGLIDCIDELSKARPEFHYFLDGQTLIIEDLLRLKPTYYDKVAQLIKQGNLTIGPYYCQPDWQLTSGESLIRNLQYGLEDVAKFGSQVSAGWLVDTFGHISQAPQIHAMFGIESVYVWRGVPRLEPFFEWEGADGQTVLGINLFGGYRNLYGLSHAPDVVFKRLQGEQDKLAPYYPDGDIPLFDGYDLEIAPEDPIHYCVQHHPDVFDSFIIKEATPDSFAKTAAGYGGTFPTIAGELNSGKYGATFPGTFSARTYLKLMARDSNVLLYRWAEPMAALASKYERPYPTSKFEQLSRKLLKNAVHDCICGVSIDQVHEKMAYSYRAVWDEALADLEASLTLIGRQLATGRYAVSNSPLPQTRWVRAGDELLLTKSAGVGVWPIVDTQAVELLKQPIDHLKWKNAHYEAELLPDGRVAIGDGRVGQLLIFNERGDSYSDEPGPQLGAMSVEGPIRLIERSQIHQTVQLNATFQTETITVTATVRLTFDDSPLVRWQIDLDSRGKDFRVEFVAETGIQGNPSAGMPFDIVERQPTDVDLFPREVDAELSAILMGQRELLHVRTFPFHDFVAISEENRSAVVFAKGLHSYRAFEDGTLQLTLRRSVEWVTAANLEFRIGDAGPFFYIPDGRCERVARHELAFAFTTEPVQSQTVQQLNERFQHIPLILTCSGNGTESSLSLFATKAAVSSIFIQDSQITARLYNPLLEAIPLEGVSDLNGTELEQLDSKQVATVVLPTQLSDSTIEQEGEVTLLTQPSWRIGENKGLPDPQQIETLKQWVSDLDQQLTELEQERQVDGDSLAREHRQYILQREKYEYLLSIYLNEQKIPLAGRLDYKTLYEPDETIVELGETLNHFRIKRRIFDYVAQVDDQ